MFESRSPKLTQPIIQPEARKNNTDLHNFQKLVQVPKKALQTAVQGQHNADYNGPQPDLGIVV